MAHQNGSAFVVDLPEGYHRKAGQKGTKFLFVSSNLSRLKWIPCQRDAIVLRAPARTAIPAMPNTACLFPA
jgi:hypothetical protein